MNLNTIKSFTKHYFALFIFSVMVTASSSPILYAADEALSDTATQVEEVTSDSSSTEAIKAPESVSAIASDIKEEATVSEVAASAEKSAEIEKEASSETLPMPATGANQPQVAIRMLGSEFNIQVLYKHPMDHANNNFIESIQMESPKGDFLGLSQFGPNAKEAYAEFMVNPKLADFKEVVLIAKSSKEGEIRTPVKLELTEKPEIERSESSSKAKKESVPAAKDEKPKKHKKLGLF